MTDEPIDLIHVAGEGNTFAFRIPDISPRSGDLEGQLRIDTTFVTGRLRMWLAQDDLAAWRDVLDLLDAGHDAEWETGSRGPMVSFAHEEFDRLAITVMDPAASMVTVTVLIPLSDDWFDDAYDRLDRVWQKWLGSA